MHFWRWKWWQIILNDCCNTSQAQLPNSVENNFSGRLPGIQYRVRMRNMMNLQWWWYEWKCPSSLKEQMIMMIIMFTMEMMETYKAIWRYGEDDEDADNDDGGDGEDEAADDDGDDEVDDVWSRQSCDSCACWSRWIIQQPHHCRPSYHFNHL